LGDFEPISDDGVFLPELGRVRPINPDDFPGVFTGQRDQPLSSYRGLYQLIREEFKDKSIIAFSSGSDRIDTGNILPGLAYFAGHSGVSVLVVDADLENPTLHRAFGVSNKEGLVDMVLYGSSFERTACSTVVDNVRFIPSGSVAPDPEEIFLGNNFIPLARNWTEWATLVFLNLPPVNRLRDVNRLWPFLNGLILLLEAEQDPESSLAELVAWPSAVHKLNGHVRLESGSAGRTEGNELEKVAHAANGSFLNTPTAPTGEVQQFSQEGGDTMEEKEKDDIEKEEEGEELDADIEKLLEEEIESAAGETEGAEEEGEAVGEDLEIEEPMGFEDEIIEEETPEELEVEEDVPEAEKEEDEELSLEDLATNLEEELAVLEEKEMEAEAVKEEEEEEETAAETGEEVAQEVQEETEDETAPVEEVEPEPEEPAEKEAAGEIEIRDIAAEAEETAETEETGEAEEVKEPEEEQPPQEEPAAEAEEGPEFAPPWEESTVSDEFQEETATGEEQEQAETVSWKAEAETAPEPGTVGEREEPEEKSGEEAAEEVEPDLSFLEEREGEEEVKEEPYLEYEEEEEEETPKRSSRWILLAGIAVVIVAGLYAWRSGNLSKLPVVGAFFGPKVPGEGEFVVEELPGPPQAPGTETPQPPAPAQPAPAVPEVPRRPAGPVLTVSGPLFPFAVHISSFKNLWLANREVVRLNRAGYTAFRVYTDVPGKGWFHRVYVGLVADVRSGRRLADELKAKGLAKFAQVRSLPYGCLLDVVPDRATAEDKIIKLKEMGYSPYVEEEAPGKLRLYVGAFATAEACKPLGKKLESDNMPYRVAQR